MTGYQETLTDPSYHRQVVVMTAPHVGNTGVNDEDPESGRIWVSGYVVRDPARRPSSWRSRRSLDDELAGQGVVGISGIDTRALTRHLRERGAMRVGVTSLDTDEASFLERVRSAPPMAGADLTGEVTTPEPYVVPAAGERRFTVAALDLGIKRMTPLRMAERGIEVHVLPASSTVEEVLATGADGVFLSNGPGDPATADRAVALTGELLGAAGAAVRHLLRQPGARPRAGAGDVQAALRPPRHQPAGAGPRDRQGRGHRAQPRLRGRRRRATGRSTRRSGPPRSPTSASTTASSRGCAASTCRPSPCSTTRRPRPARTTPAYLFDRFADLLTGSR